MTRQEAADRLKISLTKMSELITTEQLYVLRFDRQVRIPEESLDAFVRGEKPWSRPEHSPNLDTWPPTPSLLVPTDGEDHGDDE